MTIDSKVRSLLHSMGKLPTLRAIPEGGVEFAYGDVIHTFTEHPQGLFWTSSFIKGPILIRMPTYARALFVTVAVTSTVPPRQLVCLDAAGVEQEAIETVMNFDQGDQELAGRLFDIFDSAMTEGFDEVAIEEAEAAEVLPGYLVVSQFYLKGQS